MADDMTPYEYESAMAGWQHANSGGDDSGLPEMTEDEVARMLRH